MQKAIWILFFSFLIIDNFSCKTKNENSKVNSIAEENVTGIVVGVIDGDTYDVLLEGNKLVRIRMEGIDAPEKGMPFYQKAKNHLSYLCFGKQVTLKITGTDNRDRRLAFSYLKDGTELSHEMVKEGLAWHFKKYNSDSDLARLETDARTRKIGVWSDTRPMPPWKNRALHRKGISTKDSFDIVEGQR